LNLSPEARAKLQTPRLDRRMDRWKPLQGSAERRWYAELGRSEQVIIPVTGNGVPLLPPMARGDHVGEYGLKRHIHTDGAWRLQQGIAAAECTMKGLNATRRACFSLCRQHPKVIGPLLVLHLQHSRAGLPSRAFMTNIVSMAKGFGFGPKMM